MLGKFTPLALYAQPWQPQTRRSATQKLRPLTIYELQMFKDPLTTPDKEFGCFAAFLGPPATQHESKALLRVDVGAAKGKAASKNTPAVMISIPVTDLQRYT